MKDAAKQIDFVCSKKVKENKFFIISSGYYETI